MGIARHWGEVYAQSLSELLVKVEEERTRVASHLMTMRFWPPAGRDECSVCARMLPPNAGGASHHDARVTTFPLELVQDHICSIKSEGSDDPSVCLEETHTTVFSPISFRSLNLYDTHDGIVVTRCAACWMYVAVQGALCEICDAVLC